MQAAQWVQIAITFASFVAALVVCVFKFQAAFFKMQQAHQADMADIRREIHQLAIVLTRIETLLTAHINDRHIHGHPDSEKTRVAAPVA